ncbi:hypothetical protein [Actinacidiphila alni]|uniref:hypothetical protein n=1 Tax=Actinacidiphila alni TaxID=380248 RepID=UPI001160DC39|nr:hypothetical protein [Actinacidiphila alni]
MPIADRELPVEIKTLAELQAPDGMTLAFGPLGLGLGVSLTPEAAAQFQQELLADCELVPAVAGATRAAFDRLRGAFAYGVLSYDLFTVVHDLALLVRERALRDRFMEWCGGTVTFEDAAGGKPARTCDVASYDDVLGMVRRLHSKKGGPVWRLHVNGRQIKFNGMLAHLNAWARAAELLRGQRARRIETIWCEQRNFVAHGASGVETPVEAARALRNLAEYINQLWGKPTPGGRHYPGPVPRRVVALSWSSTGNRCVWPLDALRNPNEAAGEQERFLLVRAVAGHETVPTDPELLEYDARFETTRYPADYLWGPGTRKGALDWLEANEHGDDAVDTVDRTLLVREHEGTVYLPMRPEVAAGIRREHQAGRWHAVRADAPSDAFNHARGAAAGDGHGSPGVDCPAGGCAVHVLATGNLRHVLAAIAPGDRALPPVQPPRAFMPPRFTLTDRF